MAHVVAVEVEGARCGLMICEQCGAALLLDPRDSTNRVEQHEQWHLRSQAKEH